MQKKSTYFWQHALDEPVDRYTLSAPQFAKAATKQLKRSVLGGYLLVKFDIDRFAALEGRYGSACCSSLLRDLTTVLAKEQGRGRLFACVEGKFLLLAPNEAGFMAALQAQLASAVQSVSLAQYVGVVHFSFGAYVIKNQHEPIEQILQKVGVAHKTAGKHAHKTVVYYDAALVQSINQENYYNEHLLEGIANGEFKIYLQRQIVMGDTHALRAKALVRWATPDGRLVYPDSFIPQFEANGMMVHLDYYIIEQACAYLQQQRKSAAPNLVLSVNVSSVTLFQPDFAARFIALVQQYNIPPHALVIELQKSFLIEDEPTTIEMLATLCTKEFSFTAEAITSGQSNLRLLAELPVQYIKIDRKFLRAADTNPKIEKIMDGIIKMAHNLSVQVICEGVEHQADVDLLRRLGCDIAQGYYLMRAVPKEEFLHMVSQLSHTVRDKLSFGQ